MSRQRATCRRPQAARSRTLRVRRPSGARRQISAGSTLHAAGTRTICTSLGNHQRHPVRHPASPTRPAGHRGPHNRSPRPTEPAARCNTTDRADPESGCVSCRGGRRVPHPDRRGPVVRSPLTRQRIAAITGSDRTKTQKQCCRFAIRSARAHEAVRRATPTARTTRWSSHSGGAANSNNMNTFQSL